MGERINKTKKDRKKDGEWKHEVWSDEDTWIERNGQRQKERVKDTEERTNGE